IVWVVQMISPVLRCHHISGSSKRDLTVSTARTTRRQASITGKEETLCKKRMLAGFSVRAASRDAVVTLSPLQAYPFRQKGLVRQSDLVRQFGSADADRPGRCAGCGLPASYSRCFPAAPLLPA